MAMLQMAGASSSATVSSKKFDVFISFRGEDTRRKFTGHLYDALSKKVLTFIDDSELEKGDEISQALIKAIEESSASIVIFSEDYASSKWCLNELVKILECKKDHGQIVIPIFYEIDPSDVRKQTGSYGKAFAKHEQDSKHNNDELQKWKNALTEAANLAGWHSQNHRIESNFIKDIVEDVLEKLNRRHPFQVNKELVGIEEKYEDVKSLLKIGSNDVKALGLWGMGGIGKTTLAKHLYAKLCSQFEHHCFLENVREESTRCGLNVVRNNLFSKLLDLRPDAPYVETPISIRRLACKRSLIVLDDVETLEQAENLNIGNNCLGPGSRVIVTTRDKQICSQFNECAVYEVEGLKRDESLQLFCLGAFGEKHPKVGYEDLSKRATCYCTGNPLALKVLGANFRTKSKEAWESELEKLKKIPNRRIHDVLKLSFDGLDCTQQDIFLDIACFFSMRNHLNSGEIISREDTTILLDACNFFAASGIEVLLNKALLTSNYPADMTMHDLLQEMGREIVKQESPKNPGRRSRLWDTEEVWDILDFKKGTEVVEVIGFDISKIGDLYLSSDSFKSMTNLRYLHIFNKMQLPNEGKHYNVHFLQGLEWLSDKLRHLFWVGFPLESLPSAFCAERLVQLVMRGSKLKKLWDGIQKLDNLVKIDLDYSKDLIEIPDLSKAPKLRVVFLNFCESLSQLHPSIFTAPKLRCLRLRGCKNIESLKTNICSKSLRVLDLTDCSSLVEFSMMSEEMAELSFCGTAIREIPSSIWCKSSDRIDPSHLDLSRCKNLNSFGNRLSNDLMKLELAGCLQINTSILWIILDELRSLIELNLRQCCSLEALPDNIQNNSKLEVLELDDCWQLKSLPKLPASLTELRAVNCIYLDIDSIQRPMLENIFVKLYTSEIDRYHDINFGFTFLPGDHVPREFYFHTTEASIVIPLNPKRYLSAFIICIILSERLDDYYKSVCCNFYQHGEIIFDWDQVIMSYTLTDHVLLICLTTEADLEGFEYEREGDHCNISLEFMCRVNDEEEWSTEGIKGCGVYTVYDEEEEEEEEEEDESESGDDHDNFLFEFKYYVDDETLESTKGIKGYGVFPVYDLVPSLGLDCRSSSRVQIVELQSSAQFSDDSNQHSKFDLQHRAIGAEVRGSTDENGNEDDQQQLLIPPEKRRRT